ncbi:MAG: hypothetical protein R2854_23875 [Caldilineaceae bacterium]
MAVQLADAAADAIGRALAGIVTLLNVRTILFVGSVTQFGEPWLETIRATLRRSAIPQLAESTELGIAEHGPDAVILESGGALVDPGIGAGIPQPVRRPSLTVNRHHFHRRDRSRRRISGGRREPSRQPHPPDRNAVWQTNFVPALSVSEFSANGIWT